MLFDLVLFVVVYLVCAACLFVCLVGWLLVGLIACVFVRAFAWLFACLSVCFVF